MAIALAFPGFSDLGRSVYVFSGWMIFSTEFLRLAKT